MATTRKPTQYAQGYRAALEEIADLAVSDKTRDAALLAIEEWLENAGITRDWIGSPPRLAPVPDPEPVVEAESLDAWRLRRLQQAEAEGQVIKLTGPNSLLTPGDD